MTGPTAVLPRAPSSLSPDMGKPSNAAKPGEIDPAASVAFSELFAAARREADAPSPDEEADAQREESADTSQLPLPIPLAMLPEKTPQARFAEELSATLPPAFGYGNVAAAASATVSETASKAAAVAVPLPAAPVPPPASAVQALAGSNFAGAISSTLPAAAPDPALAIPPAIPLNAPFAPPRAPLERNTAKALSPTASASGDPAALAAATVEADALAASAETGTSQDRSGEDRDRGDAARGLAALKEAKVSIVLQETHFAPVPPQSPAFQIANRIMQEFATDPAFAPQSAAVTQEASAAPVKVLEIQLDPPELGALMIRMSLKDNVLHLQIEAVRHETMKLIERDQDALSGMLRSAGYSIDGLNVQITTGDRGNNAPQSGGGFNQPAGQQAERQPEGSGSGQASRSGGEPDRTREHGRETEAPGVDERRGGLVYL